jgi:hypothetical protein
LLGWPQSDLNQEANVLKGQRVLTDDYYGTVVNDAEVENAVILDVIRIRRQYAQSSSLFFAGRTWTEWHVVSERRAIPWSQIGTMTFMDKLPKGLYARRLKQLYGAR